METKAAAEILEKVEGENPALALSLRSLSPSTSIANRQP
jgi:hypothetical protein